MQTRIPLLHETMQPYEVKSKEVLAVNEEVYLSLIKNILKVTTGNTAQSTIIVGDSGSGKTFLMKRLFAAIKENNDTCLYPIFIEGKSLFSTNDIWAHCVAYLNLDGEKNAFDAIMDWQELNSKRVLLLVDNMQYYFERTDNTEQYGLRAKLNSAGSPILIASSEMVLPAFTEYDAAFFDGFKISYLKPLSMTAVENITKGKYDVHRLENLMSYMPKTIRSLYIAIDILGKSDAADKDLDYLSDYFYARYQTKFEAASTQMQRILAALSQAETGFSLSEIRAITRLDNGKISPYLKLMIDQKLISKEAKSMRSGIYYILDPLFKLWLRHNAI